MHIFSEIKIYSVSKTAHYLPCDFVMVVRRPLTRPPGASKFMLLHATLSQQLNDGSSLLAESLRKNEVEEACQCLLLLLLLLLHPHHATATGTKA
jgi:hypothetical protein